MEKKDAAVETPPERVKHSSLASAICAVMEAVKAIHMTGRLKVSDTKAVSVASVSDITRVLQPEMAKHGVIILPSLMESATAPVGKSRSGIEMYRTDIKVTWTIVHADSDQTFQAQTVGSGSDMAERGAYKAMTGALKYIDRLVFHLPTADDPDTASQGIVEPAGEEHPAEQSDERPAGQPARKHSGATISDAQGKRIFAIVAAASGDRQLASEVIKECLSRHGISHTKELTTDIYEDFISEAMDAMRLAQTPE